MRTGLKLLLLIEVLAALPGCWTGSYLARQGLGQWRLLRARRRIGDVLGDPAVDGETKARLKLAVAARDFGVRVLGLKQGDSYTRYLDTRGAPIAWNVAAAPRDKLEPYLFRFPISGAIPYLGFFKEEDARREEERLKSMDLDTSVREVAGYSTLGFLSDPVYSSMLEGSETRIVEVVLHEMLHGTVYWPGHSDWNESVATFVGLEGAAAFFRARGSESTAAALAAEAERRRRDEEAFADSLRPVIEELKALYGSERPKAEKLRLREEVFARARRDYLVRFPLKPGHKPGGFVSQPLNNAVLSGYLVYHRATPDHRRLLARLGGDLARFVRLCRHAVEVESDPLEYLASEQVISAK